MQAFAIPLPRVTRGFTEVSPGARAAGASAAEAISAALSSIVGEVVRVAGGPVPGAPSAGVGVAAVTFALPGVSGAGALEIDTGLLSRLLERMLGAGSGAQAALSPTRLERALLAVLSLVAIDAARAPEIDALAPRLVLDDPPPPVSSSAPCATEDLAVALEIRVGEDRGRGQLRLPPSAVRALGAAPAVVAATSARLAIDASWREGTVTMTPDDLAALGCGDVLLVDEGPESAELVLPGGLTLRGSAGAEVFEVEEIRMTETQAGYPITLTIEIARVTITLGELARLAPGAALAIDARKDGAVVLRAGEHVVARGQLVDVEGALGVRVVQLGAVP